MGEKILVTGAAGFIGRRLTERLLKGGAEVRCLLRHFSAIPRGLSGAELVQGDLLDSGSLKAAMEGVSTVYHCAALVRPAGFAVSRAGLEKRLFSVNADGAGNAAAEACAAGAGVFIHLSSIAAQGPGWSLRENDYCRPLTMYGRSKLASEAAAADGIAEGGPCRLVIARPAMIYGKDSPSWGKFFACIKGGLVPVPGRGGNTLSVCWIENLIDALILLAQRGKNRETYTVSEGPRSWEDMAALAAAAMGARARVMQVPRRPLSLLSFLAAAALRPTGLALPALNYLTEPGSLREAIADWGHDTTKLNSLGWTPRLTTAEALSAELAPGHS